MGNMLPVSNNILKYLKTSELFFFFFPLETAHIYSKIWTSNNLLEKGITFFMPLFFIAKVMLI